MLADRLLFCCQHEKSIDILFDGKLVHHYVANSDNNIEELFGKKQRLVFNIAVGGWFIEETDSTIFADSSTMEVDWVRAYRR